MGTPRPWEWGNIAEEEAQGSKGRGLRSAAQTTPPLCLAVAGSSTAQGGGSLHEKSEGTSCKFNYCLNLYVEIYLHIHI